MRVHVVAQLLCNIIYKLMKEIYKNNSDSCFNEWILFVFF